MPFEWDEAKRQDNLAKHGVDFVRAAKIVRHAVFEAPDERTEYGERRFKAIGHWDQEVFVVVYTWRGAARRIISAWKAGRRDREAYFSRLR